MNVQRPKSNIQRPTFAVPHKPGTTLSRHWILGVVTVGLMLVIATPPLLLAQTTDFQVYRGTQVPPEVERIYEKGLKWLVAAQIRTTGRFPRASRAASNTS
jgi:hypothetical protein